MTGYPITALSPQHTQGEMFHYRFYVHCVRVIQSTLQYLIISFSHLITNYQQGKQANKRDRWQGRWEQKSSWKKNTNNRKVKTYNTAETMDNPYRVCCPCQYTEHGGRLEAELSAPKRKSWPAGVLGWGTGLGLGEPGPSVRLGRLSSWPCWSHQAPGRWRWHPASVWRCCHRFGGSDDAKPPRLPLCKVLWCQHHSSLGIS